MRLALAGAAAPRVQRKCSCGGTCPQCQAEEQDQGIQTKVTVGAPDDAFEREADEVADKIT